jgi:hypothetical protein
MASLKGLVLSGIACKLEELARRREKQRTVQEVQPEQEPEQEPEQQVAQEHPPILLCWSWCF